MKKILETKHTVDQWRLVDGLWQMVGKPETNDNIFTLEGMYYVMDAMFSNTAYSIYNDLWNFHWYVAIFKSDYTPQETDTGAHPGWLECGEYDETTRPYYNKDFAAGITMSNYDEPGIFTINDTVTIYGSALVDSIGKNGVAERLIASAKWTTARPAISGDILRVTIDITGVSG